MSKLLTEKSREESRRRELRQLFKHTPYLKSLADIDDETLVSVAEGMQKGVVFGTPVFDGATEKEIKSLLDQSGLPTSDKTELFDGITGEKFEEPVKDGSNYMLKLSHPE